MEENWLRKRSSALFPRCLAVSVEMSNLQAISFQLSSSTWREFKMSRSNVDSVLIAL